MFGGDFEVAVNKAKALLDSATDSSGLVEYRNQLKLLQNEFKSLNLDRSSWSSLIDGDTLATNIATAQLRIQNLKSTYSSFVSDPKLMSEWQALFDQSQIVTTQKELNNLNAQVKQFEQKLISAGKNSTNVFSRLAQSMRSMASWMIFGTIFSSVMRGVRGVYDAVVDLDTQMIELRKVTDETSVAYDQFLDRTYDKAIRLGTSVTELTEATANFARLGFSIGDAEELAELALVYKNVGDEIETVDDATQSIISTMKAFDIQSQDASSIIDKFNEVSNNFAITAGRIGDSLQRSAASLAVANNTLDESIALTVASNNVIQDPDRVGTMWQTVTARIRGAKTELEEAGLETENMAESTSKLRETVMALTNIDGLGGFDIMVDEETFKSTYDILLGISKVWKNMSDIDQAALLELLAGKRQSNALAAAITNMDTAVKVLNTSLNSTGSAYAEHTKWLDSIEAKQQQFTAQFQEFANTFLSSDLVKGVISTGTGMLGWLTALTDKLGALPVLLSAIGGIRSLAGNHGLFEIDSSKNWGGSGIGITTSFAASKKAAAELAEQLNADVICLQNFEDAVQSGSYATGDFDKIMAGASSQAKTYAATTKGAAGSTMQYKVTQDAAASSTKAMGISAKTAGVGVRILNTAMNMLISMGIGLAINAIIAGFDALVNAASKASEKANELAEEQREIADAAAEEAESIDELIDKYKQLRKLEYVDADSRAEVRDIQSQITSLVGDQASNLDLVNGKLDDEIKKLKEIQLESAKASQDAYVASYHADREAADQAVGEDKFLFVNGYGYVGPRDNDAYEILKGLKNSDGGPLFQKGGFFGSSLFSMETGSAEERIAQLTKAMETLKNAADYDYTDSDLYAGLSAAVKVCETYTAKLNESTAGLVDSTVQVAALQADISGYTINSAEAYEKYRQSVIDAALADNALSSGLKDGAISVNDITAAVDDLMATNFPDWYNQAKESVMASTGASTAVQQYKDISEALEAVKKAQDAYNSVKEDISSSSDGSISLSTLISLVNTYSDLSTVVSDYLAGTASASDILDVLAGKFKNATVAAGYYQESLSELEEVSDFKIAVDSLSSYEDAYASLSDTLGEFMENGIVSAETIAGLMATFGDTKALKDFIFVLGQEGVTASQVKEALNSLGEEYLSNSEILDQLTKENAGLVAATLEANGVTNAQEVVANRLAAQQLEVQYATELASMATWEEVEAFLQEQGAAADVINTLHALRAEKYNATLAATDFANATANEIDSLLRLANAAGVAAEKITLLKMIQTASQGWATAKASGMLASDYEWLKDLTYDQIQDMFQVDMDSYGIDFDFGVNVTPTLSSSSSTKEVEAYTAEIDKFRESLERLERVQQERERVELHLSNTDDLEEQIGYHNQLIGLYQDEQAAMHALNEERDAYIQAGVDKLRGAGFEVEYDAVNNKFFVENLEHLNELAATSQGSYGSMQEATNAYIQEMEDLIDELADLNDANAENSESWWDLQYSIRDAKVSIVNNLKDIVSAASDSVDEIQNVSDVLKSAADEYAANGGFISVDAYQKLVELGPEYMQYLQEENGLLIINEERINAVIAAKTEQLALENAMAYVERLRLALQEDSVEDLNNLLYATTEATDASWGLVYANLALLDLNGDQYQAALHNIQAIRSLAETAVSGIGQVVGGYADELNSMKDGLDDILDYVMDMLQDRVNQQIDALETMKDNYADIIALQKERLKLAQQEREYADEVADKTAELAKLESRRAALELAANSGDRNAQLELGSVVEQIQDLQKDLDDYQYEHYVSTTEDALDKELEDFENQQDEKIALLKDSISSTQKIYSQAIDYISNNWDTLYDDLVQWNYSYGSSLTSEITTAWDKCLAAAQRYGSYVAAMNQIDTDIASASGSGNTGNSGASNNIIVGASSSNTSANNDEIVKALVSQMKANSAAWFTSSNPTALTEQNDRLAARIEDLLELPLVRGQDGVWYIGNVGGQKLYEKYHTGGIVGGDSIATTKQNELWALLKKGEIVVNTAQQNGLWNMLSALSPANSVNNALKYATQFTHPTNNFDFHIEAPVTISEAISDRRIVEAVQNQQRKIANIIYRDVVNGYR